MSSPEPILDPSSKAPGSQMRNVCLVLGVLLVLVIAAIFWKRSTASTAESTAPAVVGVAKVTRADLFNEVTIPAEFRPYVEVELHAKVAGYVDQMNVDFGDKVKSGQLLATLEVPELRDQLHNAMAMQQKAEADYTNANLLYNRLQTVNEQHPNLVAQQELDDAQAKQLSANAAIAAAKAEVERYQTLTNYTRIVAPFDGVITRRSADPGALIQAGTSSETQPLLRVSDNYHLRLDFPVSVQYVKDIHPDEPVQVRVESLGGKNFTGKISRFTQKVNEDTRTMTVEVELPNPDLQIVPGMYAAVQLKVQQHSDVLSVPIQAVAGEKEPAVYVVNDKSEIEPRPVTVGVESPDKCEIVSGLKEGELVMIGNRSLVQPGQKVETKIVTEPAMP
ncbi:MAG TPA: efflux RND transporter periplasmic adaptor subunit [Verrucomicrobiae bacterium]|nr:efflux RND transporter periplasmic adaptor subunit [Verrucomicrobiae bacterium]